jgi:phosphatidylinositol alpha-1,6-mannosyltransferase
VADRTHESKTHLLLTNDFPPKVGGIQVYLWELWRRLDPGSFTVLTAASHPGAASFDAAASRQGIGIERYGASVLLPSPALARRVRAKVAETGAGLVVIDPALPLGMQARSLGVPYAVVLHGAEVTVPARLPVTRSLLSGVLSGARLAICAGTYPAREALRAAGSMMPEVLEVPPGVDSRRFRPLDGSARSIRRRRLGVPEEAFVVLGLSRLVPRKGFDVLIDAIGHAQQSVPGLVLVIAGTGRDAHRLVARAAARRVRLVMLGHVRDEDLADVYGLADVLAVPCRDRWGGLEAEGFGIVFLEAAACGVPQIAGASGGAADAVVDGETGLVLADPRDPPALAMAIRRMAGDPDMRRRMAEAGRRRAVESFDWDLLARRLAGALEEVGC